MPDIRSHKPPLASYCTHTRYTLQAQHRRSPLLLSSWDPSHRLKQPSLTALATPDSPLRWFRFRGSQS